jgi:hypothetical protein
LAAESLQSNETSGVTTDPPLTQDEQAQIDYLTRQIKDLKLIIDSMGDYPPLDGSCPPMPI